MASSTTSTASWFERQAGGEAAFVTDARGEPAASSGWTAAHGRSRRPPAALGERGEADGITMNSWKSTFESACAPPLRMFIIGTGRV
jgi:hypothetical protein